MCGLSVNRSKYLESAPPGNVLEDGRDAGEGICKGDYKALPQVAATVGSNPA